MVYLLIDYTPVLDIAGSDNYKKSLNQIYVARKLY